MRRVTFSRMFARHARELSRKYRRIQQDINEFADELETGATLGDRIQGVGDYVAYKARVASSDMQCGKRGGFRVVYYVRTATHLILLDIYAKVEQENIPAGEVIELIEIALEELEETPDEDTHGDD